MALKAVKEQTAQLGTPEPAGPRLVERSYAVAVTLFDRK